MFQSTCRIIIVLLKLSKKANIHTSYTHLDLQNRVCYKSYWMAQQNIQQLNFCNIYIYIYIAKVIYIYTCVCVCKHCSDPNDFGIRHYVIVCPYNSRSFIYHYVMNLSIPYVEHLYLLNKIVN